MHYNNAAPWPTQPASGGPALIRVHVADYGSDPATGWPSNVGGTPGAANLALDPLPPTVPTNLAAQATVNPSQINLTWTASTDTRSSVAYYDVYRNGTMHRHVADHLLCRRHGPSGDQLQLHRQRRQSRRLRQHPSAAIVANLPGVVSYLWLNSQHMQLFFSEPLNPSHGGSAQPL